MNNTFERLWAKVLVGGAVAFCAVTHGHAQNMQFGGTVSQPNFCSVVVENDGEIVQNTLATEMSSEFSGGVSGSVRVFSWWRYNLRATPLGYWLSSPIPSNAETDFTAFFSGAPVTGGFLGRVSFPRREGSNAYQLPIGPSWTRLTIDLEARHQTSGFPAGSYETQVVVTCD